MIDKIYNPKDIEQPLYSNWEQQGYFEPNNNNQQDSYCIMIPPPNITGSLHMGHAFQQTIMDILIRYQRMQGKNTLWQVGTDHAGIATQMIVERKIYTEEGKTRHDYGREAFINTIWQWNKQSNITIKNQIRRLGNSVDWKRERFTMDEELSNAVREVFVRLYQEDLIYRGKRLVNWDPKLRTAISDLEVEHRESKSFIWYLRYPLADGIRTKDDLDYLIIATTRPETMLGDTGIAIHPNDLRYNNLIGKFVILPLVNRRIPIVGDTYTDMIKGTGCVKITPAHDFNDYEIGKRHTLQMINIFTFDGKIRDEAEVFDTNGKISNIFSKEIPITFRAMERFVARKTIVTELNRLGFVIEIKTHNLMIPYSDRGGVIIEPMLTDQWYVRTLPLAKLAIKAVEQGTIRFIPKQYEKMYFNWMNNIQDWCISRQLWWGHRIPAWYDNEGLIYVGRSKSEIYQYYKLKSDVILKQDNDVLDTWFSSGLWTFASLGWPKKTDALYTFHPTNVIVSGFDIIFFWIARMIMLTMHFIKDKKNKPQIPFNTVYMTGLIRDEEGQKMSKSKGNVIDPLDIIDGISLTDIIKKRTINMMQPQLANKIRIRTIKEFPNGIKPHGSDALRFTLTALASNGRDINWSMKRLSGYQNFCNKLWHASRFVLIKTENQDCGFNGGDKILSLSDRWILTEFNQTVESFRKVLDNYRFDLAANILYEFTWNQFCDWYLELTKSTISNGSDAELRGTRHTLIIVLEALLRLAHPIIPFITETIWQQIKTIMGITNKNDTIMLQPFPSYDASLLDTSALHDVTWIKRIIIAIRTIRAETQFTSKKQLTVLLRHVSPIATSILNKNLNLILHVAHIHSITILPADDQGPVSITKIIDGAELLIPMMDLINKDIELKRLTKEIARIKYEIDRIVTQLNNKDLINYAPKDIVSNKRDKLKKYQKFIIQLLKQQKIIANL